MKCNNIWHPTYDKIKQGHWCIVCALKNKTHDPDFVKSEIEKRDGTLLTEYIKNEIALNIKCNKCKTIWHPAFSSVMSGHWCPGCQRYSFDDVKLEVELKGGTLLTIKDEYENCYSRLCIRCNKCLNEWHPTFSNIKHGTWCPTCSNGKNQNKIRDLIKDIFQGKEVFSNFNKFGWLKSKRGIQHIDIFVSDIKLAIEYDGEQHSRPVCFGGISFDQAKEEFKKTKRRDNLKNKKIAANKNDVQFFIRIDYTELPIVNKEYLIGRLKNIGVPISTEDI